MWGPINQADWATGSRELLEVVIVPTESPIDARMRNVALSSAR